MSPTTSHKTRPTLGPQVAIYHCRPLDWRDILATILGVVLIAASLGYGIWRRDYAYAHYGAVAADFWSRPWFLLGAFTLFLFLLFLVYRLHLFRRFVAVHKNGVRLRLGFFRLHSILWSEIAGISSAIIQKRFFHLTLRTYQYAILHLRNGKKIHLQGSLLNIPELITRLKASLYPRLLPKLNAEFQTGEWLYFGPVSIHLQGMQLKKKKIKRLPSGDHNRVIPWSKIEHVTVEHGLFRLSLKDQGSQNIPISQIPNFEILIQLIQQGVQV